MCWDSFPFSDMIQDCSCHAFDNTTTTLTDIYRSTNIGLFLKTHIGRGKDLQVVVLSLFRNNLLYILFKCILYLNVILGQLVTKDKVTLSFPVNEMQLKEQTLSPFEATTHKIK